jgi:hypothetical protein
MIVKLTNVRLSFPDLFKATQVQGEGAFSYRASFLFAPGSPTHKALTKAFEEVATEKFKNKAKDVLAAIKDRSRECAMYSGDTKSYDGYAGNIVLTSSRAEGKGMPLVLGGGAEGKSPLADNERHKIYAGCYVNASVEVWAQDNKYGKGIRSTLRGVQFLRDGDSFGAGSATTVDEFDDIAVEDNDDLA